MKKSLSCAQLGITECSFEVRSVDREDIKDALFYHAQKIHPDKIANLSDKERNALAHQMDRMIS